MASNKENDSERRSNVETQGGRFVAVSNRLPVVVEKVAGDVWNTKPGSGGLVTALAPVLRNRGGVWIGWPGDVKAPDLAGLFRMASNDAGYRLCPIILTKEEIEGFYSGFSNSIIWPLFHDLVTRCEFLPGYWEVYCSVNRKFAKVIAEQSRDDDYVWVHDYHLMNVAQELRSFGAKTRKAGFFLHIPFPPMEAFLKLPWRADILHALLEYDLVGFQTVRDRANFIDCIRALLPEVGVAGKGAVVVATLLNKEIRLGTFPISIDFKAFSNASAAEDVITKTLEFVKIHGDRKLMLGIDRLDYTKGIPERLKAFRNALERFPELLGKVTFIQVVVPSRVDVPEYRSLQLEIEQLVGEINGKFTFQGWVPIHYLFRSLSKEELLIHYRAADVALITPLRDGMNLVAKEYCACKTHEDGVLILSEFAGAATQMHKWALMVNPFDVEGVAEAICMAFSMDADERKTRMKRLRESVRRNDIYRWVKSFLKAAGAKKLEEFPILDQYFPPFNAEKAFGEQMEGLSKPALYD